MRDGYGRWQLLRGEEVWRQNEDDEDEEEDLDKDDKDRDMDEDSDEDEDEDEGADKVDKGRDRDDEEEEDDDDDERTVVRLEENNVTGLELGQPPLGPPTGGRRVQHNHRPEPRPEALVEHGWIDLRELGPRLLPPAAAAAAASAGLAAGWRCWLLALLLPRSAPTRAGSATCRRLTRRLAMLLLPWTVLPIQLPPVRLRALQQQQPLSLLPLHRHALLLRPSPAALHRRSRCCAHGPGPEHTPAVLRLPFCELMRDISC